MSDIPLSQLVYEEGCADIDCGVWYQSAVSSLWYRNKDAAGEICAIRTNGQTEYQSDGG